MTWTDTRAALATALDTADPKIRGHEFPPGGLGFGDAWPQLRSLVRGPGSTWEAAWSIWVVLGADELVASKYFDDFVPLLMDALEPLVFIDQVAPVTVQVSGGEVLALEISARSE